MSRTRLHWVARETLHAAVIAPEAWLALNPNCDACGCSDDCCIGYHHDEADECGCLPVLIVMAKNGMGQYKAERMES